jgi:hypothetical protein
VTGHLDNKIENLVELEGKFFNKFQKGRAIEIILAVFLLCKIAGKAGIIEIKAIKLAVKCCIL